MNRFKNILLCILSAILITLAFPKTDFWILSWIALVPLLLALEGLSKGGAFWLGYLWGILVFSATLWWLTYVTALGLSVLILYLSLYPAIFSVGARGFDRLPPVWKLFALPSVWVVCEFVRGSLFTGLGWVNLSLSQYKNLPVIQIADITGAAGISFLIVMVNYAVKEWLVRKRAAQNVVVAALICVLVVIGYGTFRLLEPVKSSGQIKVAVVQGNIPQDRKWNPQDWPSIMEKYLDLTRQAAAHKPDMIIWPETSFPGFIWESPELFRDLKKFVKGLNTPLLVGAITLQNGINYYNTAILISAQGEVVKEYYKIHLVPFGEFIPFSRYLSFLVDWIGIGDFTSGSEWTLLPAGADQNFAVLICFEDTFPYLARNFTSRGANLLINMTNDAWFEDTKEPFMHLSSSVLRAVENRRSVIRAANTGVSGFINDRGTIYNFVQNEKQKKTYVSGFTVDTVFFRPDKTFYTKFGEFFTLLCFGCILGALILLKSLRRSTYVR